MVNLVKFFYQHQEKAHLIWQAFKDRLGISSFTAVSFDLASLLSNAVDLTFLANTFSRMEIDPVVKALPSDKSPRPDGFNTYFIKKCWSIICEDFYTLYSAFYFGYTCFQNINGSYMKLVPKKDDASNVVDYRPISLLHCSIKIITRFWLIDCNLSCLLWFIHQNQYDFIRNRTIEECIAWGLEYVHVSSI